MITGQFTNLIVITHKKSGCLASYNHIVKGQTEYINVTSTSNSELRKDGEPWTMVINDEDIDHYQKSDLYDVDFNQHGFYVSLFNSVSGIGKHCTYIKDKITGLWIMCNCYPKGLNEILPNPLTDKEYMIHKVSNFEQFRDLLDW